MNLEKTVATMFHMSTNFHDKKLEVRVGDRTLKHATNPTYLGLVLDRGMNFREHVEAMTRKVNKRVHLLKRLTGTTWGACSTLLRQAVLALCYSPAEYCAPAFARSAYVSTLDTGLNKAMRVVTGSLKSTPTQWLPVMAAIQPPHIRREAMTQKWVEISKKADVDTPLTRIVREAPKTRRLKTRKPFYAAGKEGYDAQKAWESEWASNLPSGAEVVQQLGHKLPGFAEGRKYWVAANRLRARTARVAALVHKWGERNTPLCPFGCKIKQDVDHLVSICPTTRIPSGHRAVHEMSEAFLKWVDGFDGAV